jgi:broad specificity phosphatase PhoE
MFGVYITHPQVQIDPLVPVPRWGLSDLGRSRASATARLEWVAALTRIISSDETKATETADILAAGTGIAVEIAEDMGENDRSATGFLPPPAFETAADWFFAHPQESYRGWERAIDAQTRIAAAVDRILETHDPALPIAFVGHGGVGTLLKCHLGNRDLSRSEDQPAGGGNLFAFRLADRTLACDWTAMEEWRGFGHVRT